MITVPWTRNERSAVAGLKTTSYAENVVALAKAHAAGRLRGALREHGGAALRGHRLQRLRGRSTAQLHTPPLASGCLAGITRALTVEWTGAHETALPLDVLESADEIFLTSTLRDVQAVHRVDGRVLARRPGPVTAKAMRIFDERAGADLDP